MSPRLVLPQFPQPTTTSARSTATPRLFLPTPLPSPSTNASPDSSTTPPAINEPPTPVSPETTSPEPLATSTSRTLATVLKPTAIRLPACLACRKKKRKCDHQQPCALCARLNQECVYDSNPDGSSKRWREMEDAERFMKQFQAGGAMRPLVVTENPATVSPSLGLSPADTVEPDVVEVDAMGKPVKEHITFVAPPVLPVVDTTQWPRRKKVKRSYQDPLPPKPVLPILPKTESTASSDIPFSQVLRELPNINILPAGPTNMVATEFATLAPANNQTLSSDLFDESSTIDMDTIFRGIENMDPDVLAGFSMTGYSQGNDGPDSAAILATGNARCAVPSQFSLDDIPQQQVSIGSETETPIGHDVSDLEWMKDLPDLNEIMDMDPLFSTNAEGTIGTPNTGTTVPNFLEELFRMDNDSRGAVMGEGRG